ncbi:MAG: hypothetical protein ACKON9_30935, partial [Planctomycetaceae bacterium]
MAIRHVVVSLVLSGVLTLLPVTSKAQTNSVAGSANGNSVAGELLKKLQTEKPEQGARLLDEAIDNCAAENYPALPQSLHPAAVHPAQASLSAASSAVHPQQNCHWPNRQQN